MAMKLIAIVMLFYGVYSNAGHDKDNGGDPNAAEFLKLGGQILDWLPEQNQWNSVLPVNLIQLKYEVLRESLNNEDAIARVEFVSRDLKDKNGISKSAICNLETGKIIVDRREWSKFTSEFKYVQVLQELLCLVGLENRYTFAQEITDDFVKNSESPNPAVIGSCIGPNGLGQSQSLQLSNTNGQILTIDVGANSNECQAKIDKINNKSSALRICGCSVARGLGNYVDLQCIDVHADNSITFAFKKPQVFKTNDSRGDCLTTASKLEN